MAQSPADIMRNSADVQESRNAEYGAAYKRHGPAIAGLFPDGVVLVTESDHTRFAILTLLFGKLTRYAGSFHKGGHEDSLTDLIAYTAMLKECDQEAAEAATVEAQMRASREAIISGQSLGATNRTEESAIYDPRLEK